MVDKIQSVLSVLRWVALGVVVWFVVTGRSVHWVGPTLFALVFLSRGLDAWVHRVPRSDFKKPRSFYPNGDNGYNDRSAASRSVRYGLDPDGSPKPPRHRGGGNLRGG